MTRQMPIGAALAWDDVDCEVNDISGGQAPNHVNRMHGGRQKGQGPRGRRAGCGVDAERWAGRGHRAGGGGGGRLGVIEAVDCGGLQNQAAGSRLRGRGAAVRDRGGAAGRGGFPDRAGPPARRRGGPADHAGAGPGLHDRGRAGPPDDAPALVGSGRAWPGGGDRADAGPAAGGAGGRAGRAVRPPSTCTILTWRSTAGKKG